MLREIRIPDKLTSPRVGTSPTLVMRLLTARRAVLSSTAAVCKEPAWSLTDTPTTEHGSRAGSGFLIWKS